MRTANTWKRMKQKTKDMQKEHQTMHKTPLSLNLSALYFSFSLLLCSLHLCCFVIVPFPPVRSSIASHVCLLGSCLFISLTFSCSALHFSSYLAFRAFICLPLTLWALGALLLLCFSSNFAPPLLYLSCLPLFHFFGYQFPFIPHSCAAWALCSSALLPQQPSAYLAFDTFAVKTQIVNLWRFRNLHKVITTVQSNFRFVIEKVQDEFS